MSKSRGGRRKENEYEDPKDGTFPAEPEVAAANGAVVANSTFPNSPPPSYEYVLEEARLEQTPNGTNQVTADDLSRMIYDGGNSVHQHQRPAPVKGPEILHKSSKAFYRAVAKQCGITCKMSDQCRCFDCQSHYFDCEYEKDEQGKTDGGLSAGTPMFISEVMHGTACSLL